MFVVDDHEIVRTGVRGLLKAEPDLEVVGVATVWSAALGQSASGGDQRQAPVSRGQPGHDVLGGAVQAVEVADHLHAVA